MGERLAVAGAVLTGGRSTRMGADKALLAPAGEPLALAVADVLAAAGAARVIAVGGDLDGLRAVGLDAIADAHPGAGPLGGIATALGVLAEADIVAVLACDLVAASPIAVRAVVETLAAHAEAMVAVPEAAGHRQTLHAAWRPAALPVVEVALAAGRGAVRDALDALPVVVVRGLDEAWFANANTPAELAGAGVRDTVRMSDVPEIDIAELARRRADGAYLLDVRQPDEYEAAHVPGAVLIPLDQLPVRQEEVPTDEPLLVICQGGGRSAAAVRALTSAGYDATNVAGGTKAWIEAGHDVVVGPEAG